MSPVVLLCSGWLAVAPAVIADTDRDLVSYESAKLTAGRDPEAHIRLALWCEANGLEAERIKHLAIAVLTDPANATARGLMGLVAYRGRWQRPESVGKAVEADSELKSILVRYHEKRIQAPYTAEGQWKLALWCEENGLKDQARAHLMVVTSLEPGREAAWKRLGYKKVDRRWVTPEQLAAERDESSRQKHADRKWKSVLERARDQLASKSRRVEAEDDLSQIRDPRAVPSICRVFGQGEANQNVAVRLLGQIDSPEASRALAELAVGSRSAEVRRAAAETLVRRDPRDFARWLTSLLAKPVKYEVKAVGGPGSPGELFVEGKQFNVKRLYSPPAVPTIQPGDRLGVDEAGRPVITRVIGYDQLNMTDAQARAYFGLGLVPDVGKVPEIGAKLGLDADGNRRLQEVFKNKANELRYGPIPTIDLGGQGTAWRYTAVAPRVLQIPVGEMAVEAQRTAEMAERQLESDIATIKKHNAPIVQRNERVLTILTRLTDTDLGEDPESWKRWAIDLLGYAYLPQMASPETPTITEQVPLAIQPQVMPIVGNGPTILVRERHACFGGGTLVSTLAGPRRIEDLRTGDQVLAQDTTTGALSYQPLVAVFHNPPNQTLRLELDGESIVVTGIHRFWKPGRGWSMARELKVGDIVRTVEGVARVDAVASDHVQPVFNLQVAEGQSFFVGRTRALVHDNSLVETVAEPFDAAPSLEAVAHKD